MWEPLDIVFYSIPLEKQVLKRLAWPVWLRGWTSAYEPGSHGLIPSGHIAQAADLIPSGHVQEAADRWLILIADISLLLPFPSSL